MLQLGNIATDGTKIQGNASRHKAMSYGYMHEEADRLREDIEALVTQADEQDAEDDAAWAAGVAMSCPPSWRAVPTAWPRSRRHAASGGPGESGGGGRAPAPCRRRGGTPAHGHHASRQSANRWTRDSGRQSPDQLARSELQIMWDQQQRWEYCGNAQASVDAAHQIIVACDVTTESE